MEQSTGNVTLEAFAARVGCHFTTASRLRAGQRLPGRRLLGRIVKEYVSDPKDREEAMRVFTEGDSEEFGEFLRNKVFEVDADAESEKTGDTTHAANGSAAA